MEGALGVWFDAGVNSGKELDDWFTNVEQPAAFKGKDFLQVRRYESLSEGPRYFCLYEYASANTVSLRNTPSPFSCENSGSADSIPGFISRISHLGGGLVLSMNRSIGGTAMTFRLAMNSEFHVTSLLNMLSHQIFPLSGITSVKFWVCGANHRSLKKPSGISFPREAAVLIEGVRPGVVASAWNECSVHQALRFEWPLLNSTAYRLLQVVSDPR